MTDRRPTSSLTDTTIDRLAESVTGVVLRPGDATYDERRRVFNAMIDRHPPMILRPADAADVVTAVRSRLARSGYRSRSSTWTTDSKPAS